MFIPAPNKITKKVQWDIKYKQRGGGLALTLAQRRAEIVMLAKEGKTSGQIAELLGMDKGSFSRLLRTLGLKITKRGE